MNDGVPQSVHRISTTLCNASRTIRKKKKMQGGGASGQTRTCSVIPPTPSTPSTPSTLSTFSTLSTLSTSSQALHALSAHSTPPSSTTLSAARFVPPALPLRQLHTHEFYSGPSDLVKYLRTESNQQHSKETSKRLHLTLAAVANIFAGNLDPSKVTRDRIPLDTHAVTAAALADIDAKRQPTPPLTVASFVHNLIGLGLGHELPIDKWLKVVLKDHGQGLSQMRPRSSGTNGTNGTNGTSGTSGTNGTAAPTTTASLKKRWTVAYAVGLLGHVCGCTSSWTVGDRKSRCPLDKWIASSRAQVAALDATGQARAMPVPDDLQAPNAPTHDCTGASRLTYVCVRDRVVDSLYAAFIQWSDTFAAYGPEELLLKYIIRHVAIVFHGCLSYLETFDGRMISSTGLAGTLAGLTVHGKKEEKTYWAVQDLLTEAARDASLSSELRRDIGSMLRNMDMALKLGNTADSHPCVPVDPAPLVQLNNVANGLGEHDPVRVRYGKRLHDILGKLWLSSGTLHGVRRNDRRAAFEHRKANREVPLAPDWHNASSAVASNWEGAQTSVGTDAFNTHICKVKVEENKKLMDSWMLILRKIGVIHWQARVLARCTGSHNQAVPVDSSDVASLGRVAPIVHAAQKDLYDNVVDEGVRVSVVLTTAIAISRHTIANEPPVIFAAPLASFKSTIDPHSDDIYETDIHYTIGCLVCKYAHVTDR